GRRRVHIPKGPHPTDRIPHQQQWTTWLSLFCIMEALWICPGVFHSTLGGGVVDVVNLNRDVLSYFELTKTLIEDFEYISVERLWYLTPGESMATGLHEIVSDVEVLTGLLPLVETGDIKVYFEATRDLGELGYMGDNYGHFPEGEDASADNSAAPEFVRLDDDAQTSDEEYHEIRADARRRNRRFIADLDGEGSSVNQLFAWDVNHHADFASDSASIEGGAEAEAVELDESLEIDESIERGCRTSERGGGDQCRRIS
ncbi:unnamed protein product, partial [Linum tenue]